MVGPSLTVSPFGFGDDDLDLGFLEDGLSAAFFYCAFGVWIGVAPCPDTGQFFCGAGLAGISWGGTEDPVATSSLKSCLTIGFHEGGISLGGLL